MLREENYKSNAQSWELEVVCKNKEYKQEVVNVLVEKDLDFELNRIEQANRFSIFIYGFRFSTLKDLSIRLSEVEDRLDDKLESVNENDDDDDEEYDAIIDEIVDDWDEDWDDEDDFDDEWEEDDETISYDEDEEFDDTVMPEDVLKHTQEQLKENHKNL